jgi:2-oxoglutarate ferredoxin oxidoreductase subunit beta
MPINPITSAIMNGATFVARGFVGDPKHLAMLVRKAIEHKGFSLVDVFSPCVTFNHDNDYAFFRERVRRLEDEDHDPSDWKSACEKAMLWDDVIYTGHFFEKQASDLGELEPILAKGGPIALRPLGISDEQRDRIVGRMM